MEESKQRRNEDTKRFLQPHLQTFLLHFSEGLLYTPFMCLGTYYIQGKVKQHWTGLGKGYN